jgi:dephospho-CoA kinase
MVSLAVTGGIACGKSLVGACLAEAGVPVCEADAVARAVVRRGERAHAAVVEAFGRGILAPDGEIDRAALAREVFADPAKRERLNALTHPEVMRRLRAWVGEQQERSAIAAAIIPLLFEIGDERNWSVTLCVAAPRADQIERLLARGLTREEAETRIAAQMPLSQKMERADCVIFNCGSRAWLREQVRRVLRTVRGD